METHDFKTIVKGPRSQIEQKTKFIRKYEWIETVTFDRIEPEVFEVRGRIRLNRETELSTNGKIVETNLSAKDLGTCIQQSFEDAQPVTVT